MFTSQKERQQLAREAREQEREIIRQEKRALRDLRYCAERSTLSPEEWQDFLKLHAMHGKEGIRELWESCVPYWNSCQSRNGGSQCPSELMPAGLKLSAKTRAQRQPRASRLTLHASHAPIKANREPVTLHASPPRSEPPQLIGSSPGPCGRGFVVSGTRYKHLLPG